jgi:hypothetical protein
MADVTFKRFWCFNADSFNGKHRINADPFKLLLTNTEPLISATSHLQITEIAAGAGYPSGGIPLVTVSSTHVSGLYKWIVNDVTIIATGTMAPWRYAVVYNSGAASTPVVGYVDTGATQQMTTAMEYKFDMNQIDGLIKAPTVN